MCEVPPCNPMLAEARPATPDTSSLPVTDSANWPEVYAVLAVGIFPSLFVALASLGQPDPQLAYWSDALQLTGLSACTIFVTLYLISRSGEAWARFGLERLCFSDLIFGFAMLFVAVAVLLVELRWRFVFGDPLPTDFKGPRGSSECTMMVVKLLIAAFAEELVTRAYLITRLEVLLHSHWSALVLSSLAFASYHIYQGMSGAFFAFVFGLAFGGVYVVMRNVWPLVFGHAMYNMLVELSY